MAVGDNHLMYLCEILVHAAGIVQQGQTLAGVEQDRCALVRCYQHGEAMLTQRAGDGADTVLAQHGDTKVHLQQLLCGNLGSPSFARMLNIGQNWVKPDWNRFSPTKPVNQSQYGLWKWASSSEIRTSDPATMRTMR